MKKRYWLRFYLQFQKYDTVTILLLNFAPTSDKHLPEYGLAAFRKKEYVHKQKKQQCAMPFLS